jgi:tetratricopeptide (TPR) repeat protein
MVTDSRKGKHVRRDQVVHRPPAQPGPALSVRFRATSVRLAAVRAAREAGDYWHAEKLARRAIRITRRSGAGSAELAACFNELGMIGKYSGRFTEAEAAYLQAMAILKRRGEIASANVASLLHNLAGLAHAKGEPATAEPLARRGLALRQALPNPHPRSLAEDRAALAAILVDLGRLSEAGEILGDVLGSYEQTYGPVHYEIAVTLHNLGSLQFRQRDWALARQTLLRASAMKAAVLGPHHPDIAITLHNVACCELELGERDCAITCLRQAIEILTPVVSTTHPTLVACVAKLNQTLSPDAEY